MQLRCPSCAKSLQVDEQSAGKRIKCPCGTILQVPARSVAQPAVKGRASTPTTKAGQGVAGQAAAPGKAVANVAGRAAPAQRPAGASSPQAAQKGGAGAFGIDQSEMASLFGELTDGDMVVKSPSSAPAKTKKTKDPLAAYGHAPPPSKAGQTGGNAASSSSKPASNGRRTTAIVMFVLAALFLVSAIRVVLFDKDRVLGERTGAYAAGFYVGAFLPTTICAIVGGVLIRPKRE